MQFHRDGFRAGDPTIIDAASGREEQGPLPDEVDVLIVGAGPAGLVLAAQLSVFPEITTRVIERKNGRLLIGQADGIACRTVEMFEAFGISDRILAEAYWVNETVFWGPNPEAPSEIVRTGRIPDTEAGISEFPHLIVNQARVHDYLLDTMEASASKLAPDYGVEVLAVRPSGGGPVEVDVRIADGDDLVERTIRARFVVGCDGARSTVRSSIGLELRGDRTKQAWGVIDVLVDTDFPDIRFKAAVKSVDGTILIIPREGGYLVRLYIELDRLGPTFQVPKDEITLDGLISAARHILSPYRFDVKEVAWWSVYEVGQRVLDQFDDRHRTSGGAPSVFLAGDACHTHSAKAGQGMNVSMQDAFNLGWKLAAVLRGHADRDLLLTYSDERQPIAGELIEFDRKYAEMFAASVAGDDRDNHVFQSYFQAQGRFTAGVATHYRESPLTVTESAQHRAAGFEVGMRFHSAPVLRIADSKKVELGHMARADGRWRLYLFAAAEDPRVTTSRLAQACVRMSKGSDSVIQRFTAPSADIDSVIDVRAVFQHCHDIGVENLPTLLVPNSGMLGLRDYEKAARAIEGESDVFTLRSISREHGAMVLVRPDQYVTAVLDLDDTEGLGNILESALLLNPAMRVL